MNIEGSNEDLEEFGDITDEELAEFGEFPEEDDEPEFDPEHEMLERTKWICDGTTTLSEAASRLREYAEYLEELEKGGWRLNHPSEDGYLSLDNYPVKESV